MCWTEEIWANVFSKCVLKCDSGRKSEKKRWNRGVVIQSTKSHGSEQTQAGTLDDECMRIITWHLYYVLQFWSWSCYRQIYIFTSQIWGTRHSKFLHTRHTNNLYSAVQMVAACSSRWLIVTSWLSFCTGVRCSWQAHLVGGFQPNTCWPLCKW